MLPTVRHQHILEALRNHGSVSAAALRQTFQTTAMTVWRDLKALEELGLLRRTRGGACLQDRFPGEPNYEAKNQNAFEAKRRIAALAAQEFVREGDAIVLEGGTTVSALINYLPTERISVLTNSLPVALRVRAQRPGLPTLVAGGWMSRVSGNTCGPEALRSMAKWQAAVCFVSATAFDAVVGPSDPNPLEIEAKRALAACARRVVLLLDSTKFGQRSAAVTLHPRRIHALVTDADPHAAIRALLNRHSIRVCIARK